MYDLHELSTQQKVELELMLKKGYNAAKARDEAKYLLKDSADSNDGSEDLYRYGEFVKLKRSCGEPIYVRVNGISTVEKYADKAVISVGGYQVYTMHSVESILSFLEEYQEKYGHC